MSNTKRPPGCFKTVYRTLRLELKTEATIEADWWMSKGENDRINALQW